MEDENPFSKSKTIDPEVRAYVYSLVNALGGTGSDETGRYVLGDDAIAVLRDLKRWLKLYDEKTNRLDVARCMAEANLVRGDLLPILSLWKENGKNEKSRSRLALAALELLVPLTWPIEHEEMTLNHHRHTPYILQAQVKYKAAVLHWDTTSVLRQAIRTALPALAVRRDERTPRDEAIIKLMLYFIRNIATIRQTPNLPSQGLDNEVSRSATIETFRAQDVFALLLTMCSNMGEDYNLMDVVILEIMFNLIKGVDVEKLWMNQVQRKKVAIDDLRETLTAEKSMHTQAKKKEWSRHGRFGTMIWVKGNDKQMKAVSGQDNLKSDKTAMFNVDNNKKWNKPMRKRKDMEYSMHDFDQKEYLSTTASEQLRNFVEEFLDSGFNPLFTHLRKAIEREAERLLPINYRQFFYVVAWFLKAERARREHKQKDASASKAQTEFDPESYALVACVLNQETFITLNRYMQMSWDDKAWQDLNASMRCFTEILLMVQDMAQSPLEEDQEIAENIQNRIFYEETTHDRVRLLLNGYKDQGLGYLDACTELAHVFLRLLERYSKENVDLQIKSKRKARHKRREAQRQQRSPDEATGENEDEESEHEDIMDVVQVTKERKFDFKRFAAKFVTQSSIDTYISQLTFYKDLSIEQLKRIHRFLYRAAFKQDQAILLYRLDIISLLYKLLQGPEALPETHAMFNEWQELTKQLFRKMLKKVDQRPDLLVEVLFSKVPATTYYLEHGYDKQTSTSTRSPAELEVRNASARDRKEQIAIIVTVLLRDQKNALVDWVNTIVCRAFDERHAWEAEAEAREAETIAAATADGDPLADKKLTTTTDMPPAAPSYISVTAGRDEIKIATFKNARLKLLMKLVGMVEEINDKSDTPDATWIVPSTVSASHLRDSKEAITQYSITHWQPENEDDQPEDLLRRIRKDNRVTRSYEDVNEDGEAPRDNFIDDSEGDDGPLPEESEFLFPDNPRRSKSALDQLREKRAAKSKKRKQRSDDENDNSEDDAARQERRRRRQEAVLARRQKFKSEAYIRDSDDETDEEADKLFFAKEEELRKAQAAKVKGQMISSGAAEEVDEATLTKRRKIMARLQGEDGSDEEDENVEMDEAPEQGSALPSSLPSRNTDVESDQDEDTPPSSPPPTKSSTQARRKALQELRQGKQVKVPAPGGKIGAVDEDASDSDLDIEDEEDTIVPASQLATARRSRGGFVVEDDEEEED
ncbi:Topoisomerase 1-associated factor 1 [Lithohypha guttulata]|uniref:Topoisomerase 1-associated factor 1 n=1 Tax=Lithohypha guttulata TaxID=1690604 RepID=UPI002DDDF25F|nr:Topoisomerase 1-associated factor 1 [Lithohypha guttulata]